MRNKKLQFNTKTYYKRKSTYTYLLEIQYNWTNIQRQ